ncbi:hypothetical protein EUGRSUZ_G02724 [Eucalyptus grandis]|uniref:Uncharacterized protein n=2 Tax=Eucalyptus grandis TaxID=71139 RepID=A0ACC3K7I0_EUCGR|nr:hypothetical protein EUGRSUZ_G02724 [Eucalyptus grandis]
MTTMVTMKNAKCEKGNGEQWNGEEALGVDVRAAPSEKPDLTTCASGRRASIDGGISGGPPRIKKRKKKKYFLAILTRICRWKLSKAEGPRSEEKKKELLNCRSNISNYHY